MKKVILKINGKSFLMPVDESGKPILEIASYLKHLTVMGRSINTIRTYANQLACWYQYCNAANIDPLKIGTSQYDTLQVISDFVAWTDKNKSHSPSTTNGILMTVLNYYEFLERMGVAVSIENLKVDKYFTNTRKFLYGMVKQRPQTGLYRKKMESRQKVAYITRDEFNTILAACTTARDKLLISLMFDGGMRVGEVLGLHWEDLAPEDGVVRVVYRDNNINFALAKRKANREVPIPDYVVDLLLDIIDDAGNLTDYVFVKESGPDAGKPMTYKTVEKLFERLQKKTKLHFHPHMLRHGFAVERLNDDKKPITLEVLRTLLGHKAIASTTIYAEYTDATIRKKAQEYFDSRKSETELFAHDKYPEGSKHLLEKDDSDEEDN